LNYSAVKGVEGSSGLIDRTMSKFVWSDEEKPQKPQMGKSTFRSTFQPRTSQL